MSVLDGMVIRRTTAAQQVADGLSERILAGRISPGSRLRESAIAAELGVARNTIREAVRILELSGLVEHQVNRGAVVISPTAERVEALYKARAGLELAAVSQPATHQDVACLQAAFEALTAATRTHDITTIVSADLEFHAAVVGLLGSTRIDAFYAELIRELRFYLIALSATDREYEDPRQLVAEHKAILEGVQRGDAARAAIAVRQHLETNAARLIEIVTKA